MDQWQNEALQALLETPVNEVEAGQRVYLSSATYGTSRYHLLDKRYDGIQIEQIDAEDKWSKRVTIPSDELPALLSALLSWHLEEVQRQRASASDEAAVTEDNPFDERPF